jgi:energy-coupling factor transporter ATP-binding protein EcfA2
MVRLLSIRISNLYSYDQTDDGFSENGESIPFSSVNVIVGPNDSGKSNIFRAIKLLVDSMKVDYALTSLDTFSDQVAPKLEAKFLLSENEAGVLLDFLGVYLANPNPNSIAQTQIHEFRNRKAILDLIKDFRVELSWQPTNDASMVPLSIFSFEKLGLKIFSNAVNGPAFATRDFPFKDDRRPQNGFPEFLDRLAGETDPEHQSAVNLRDSQGWDFAIFSVGTRNLANPVANRAHIEKLQVFSGLPPSTNNDLSFSRLIGAILDRSFVFSTGGTIFFKKISLIEHSQDVSKTLAQELRDSVKYPDSLDSDGWNLSEYLFNLKNSNQSQERDRFRVIQAAFCVLFPNLSVDVILQPVKFLRLVPGPQEDFRYPNIVINDARNSKQFSADKVGAGISETLFLLTAFFGFRDTVVLLDEPAVNLHPAHMKALFQMVGNSSNQLLVITHSPALLRNLLFEEEGSVIYIRRPDSKSVVRVLDTTKTWTDTERYKLSYLIDTRVFFARHILLGEGESDKDFLETAAEALGLDPDTYEDIVIDAGGKHNLKRYRDLLERFGIPYVVVADGDKQNEPDLHSRAASYGSGKNYTVVDPEQLPSVLAGEVFFFKNDVEEFMRAQDPILYIEIEASVMKSEGRVTKPVFIHEFVPNLLAKNPNSLDATIRPLLDYAFDVQHRKNPVVDTTRNVILTP